MRKRLHTQIEREGGFIPDPEVAIGGLGGDGRLPTRVLEVEEKPAVLNAIQEMEWRLRARESPEADQCRSWSRLKS